MSLAQRLKNLRDEKGLNQSQLAKEVRVDSSTISQVEQGRFQLKADTALRVANYFGVRLEWLLSGDGEKYEKTQNLVMEPQEGLRVREVESMGHLIPFYDINVTAGVATLFSDEPEVPSAYFDIPAFYGCVAVPMCGTSMMDVYYSGDILFIEPITHWKRWIPWNNAFVVITAEQRMVKVVDESKKKGHWRLVSYNPNYKPFDVPIDEVLNVFQVRGAMKQESLTAFNRIANLGKRESIFAAMKSPKGVE